MSIPRDFLSFAFLAVSLTTYPLLASAAYCTPGQPCWPSNADWIAFNRSIGGRLQQTIPWASPCFATTEVYPRLTSPTSNPFPGNISSYNAAACSAVASHYADIYPGAAVGPYRAAQYGSMQVLNWEVCGELNECLLESANASAPTLGRTCELGRLSPYYVNAKSYKDVQATLSFVQAHNLSLSIKNTGHDYVGRSAAQNSLALWTYNLKNIEFKPVFAACNCVAANGKNIGIVGAGVASADAYVFFEEYGMDVTGGAVGSVGIAGGYGQGGGHGVFGPKYGLMVDQAVEFDVVTADGKYRTINQCNDPDLFWAMRGGGGSTFAVMINYKFKLYPAVPIQLYAFRGHFPAVSNVTSETNNTVRDLVTALANQQVNFSKNNISGYSFLYPDHIETFHYYPLPSKSSSANIRTYTSTWQSILTSYPGMNISENTIYNFSTYSQLTAYQAPLGVRNTPAGFSERIAGRLIPRSLFSTSATIKTLVNAFLQGLQIETSSPLQAAIPVGGQIYSTGPANTPDTQLTTGVNPAWRSSLWEVVFAGVWLLGVPQPVQNEISTIVHESMNPLRQITPGGGCYMNEADVYEEDWQTAFFGSNYPRLLQVKQRYDPRGIFNCWKCVGWTGRDDPKYKCYVESDGT